MFVHCGTCGGPMLGHKAVKCRELNNVWYDNDLIKAFKDKIKTINGFRKLVKSIEKQKMRKRTGEESNRLKPPVWHQ